MKRSLLAFQIGTLNGKNLKLKYVLLHLVYSRQDRKWNNPSKHLPWTFVQLFFDTELLECLVHETNRFVEQSQTKAGRRNPLWKEPLTVSELKAWLGLLIAMGIHQLPQTGVPAFASITTLMMTSAQVVETSVNVTSNSPSQDYTHPDDHNLPNYDMTPGFKPFTRDPFLVILRYLHFNDNEAMPPRETQHLTSCTR